MGLCSPQRSEQYIMPSDFFRLTSILPYPPKSLLPRYPQHLLADSVNMFSENFQLHSSTTETPDGLPTPITATCDAVQSHTTAKAAGQAAAPSEWKSRLLIFRSSPDDEPWGTKGPSGGVCHLAARYRRATHPATSPAVPSGLVEDERLPCHLAARVKASAREQ